MSAANITAVLHCADPLFSKYFIGLGLLVPSIKTGSFPELLFKFAPNLDKGIVTLEKSLLADLRMPRILSMSTREVGNFTVDGISATGAILLVNGDNSGGIADWAAWARGSGNDWFGTSDNGYTAFAVLSGLTPEETYDCRVIVAGQQFNLEFTTKALGTEGTTGKQAVRRSTY